jgi:hypothetical protein
MKIVYVINFKIKLWLWFFAEFRRLLTLDRYGIL